MNSFQLTTKSDNIIQFLKSSQSTLISSPRSLSTFSVYGCSLVTAHQCLKGGVCRLTSHDWHQQLHDKTLTTSRRAATAEKDDNNKPTCSTNAIALAITTIVSVYILLQFKIYKYIIIDTVCSINIVDFIPHDRIVFSKKIDIIFVRNQCKTKMNKIYWLLLLASCVNCYWMIK